MSFSDALPAREEQKENRSSDKELHKRVRVLPRGGVWSRMNISGFIATSVLVLFGNLQNVAEIHVGKPPYTQVHYVTSGFLHVSR